MGNKGDECDTDNVGKSGNKHAAYGFAEAHPEILEGGVTWWLIVKWQQRRRGRCRSRNGSI